MRKFSPRFLISMITALCLAVPSLARAQPAPSAAEAEWFWTKLVPMNTTLAVCDAIGSPAQKRFDAVYDPMRSRVMASMPETEYFAKMGALPTPTAAEVCPAFKEKGIDRSVDEALQQ